MTTAEALFDAIDQGDPIAVDQILVADPSLATADREGVSPLRAAAYAGHPELAEPLWRRGADADVFDAAALGNVDCLRSLLDRDDRTDLTSAAGDGFTALHLAAWFGHPKAAELLLARGADPSAVATNGTELQPLHTAAAAGHVVIAHLLLDRGADVDARQAGAITALHSAAQRNDSTMVAALLGRGGDPAAVTADGRTAADLASDPQVLALLPDHPPDRRGAGGGPGSTQRVPRSMSTPGPQTVAVDPMGAGSVRRAADVSISGCHRPRPRVKVTATAPVTISAATSPVPSTLAMTTCSAWRSTSCQAASSIGSPCSSSQVNHGSLTSSHASHRSSGVAWRTAIAAAVQATRSQSASGHGTPHSPGSRV